MAVCLEIIINWCAPFCVLAFRHMDSGPLPLPLLWAGVCVCVCVCVCVHEGVCVFCVVFILRVCAFVFVDRYAHVYLRLMRVVCGVVCGVVWGCVCVCVCVLVFVCVCVCVFCVVLLCGFCCVVCEYACFGVYLRVYVCGCV